MIFEEEDIIKHDFELWIDVDKMDNKNTSYDIRTKINLFLNPQEFLLIQGALQKTANKLLKQFAINYEFKKK